MPRTEILIEGKSFPRFCGASVLVQNGSDNILVDTALMYSQQELLSALSERGLVAGDINLLVNTHLHLDHCGNNALFKSAKIAVHMAEYRFLKAIGNLSLEAMQRVMLEYYPKLTPNQLRAFSGLMAKHAEAWRPMLARGVEDRLILLEDELKIAQNVRLIMTPGHSQGHISVLVEGGEKNEKICVAGDAWPARGSPLGTIGSRFALTADLDLFERSRRYIEEWADVIIPGHDKLTHVDT